MKKNSILFYLIVFIFCLNSCVDDKIDVPEPTKNIFQTIELKIKDLRNTDGTLRIALYDNESDFNTTNFYLDLNIDLNALEIDARFDSIPAGIYSISILHDENNNEQIDKNGLGIPTEGFAFSNNAQPTIFGIDYDDAKFTIFEGENFYQEIEMIYF